VNRSENFAILKFCQHLPYKRCFHDSCGFLDSLGNERVCKFHPNPSGRFTVSVPKPVVLRRKNGRKSK
jgi:hypothetical protein